MPWGVISCLKPSGRDSSVGVGSGIEGRVLSRASISAPERVGLDMSFPMLEINTKICR